MASRVIRKVRDMLDVDDAAIANGKTLVYRTASGKHEYEAAGGAADLSSAVILAPATSARNVIQPTAGDVIAAVVKAHAAQSVDLTQWQTSAAAVLGKIGPTGCWTIQPSALGATGAVLIDAGTPPLVGPNEPQRAAFNLKATPSLATDGFIYGVRFGSYQDSNFDHPNLGRYDWLFDYYEDAGDSYPYLTMQSRRASDRRVVSWVSLTHASVMGSINPAGAGVAVGFWSLGGETGGDGKSGGLKLWDLNDFLIHESLAGGVATFAFQRVSGTWKFGVFGSAPSPVAQQAASDVGALWTALKAYGWLDAGSAAPDLATQIELDAHINDASDAHDASAVSFSPTGTIAATDVQAAIAEVASEAGGISATLFDANTVLKADTDDTPVALTMGASTILARLAAGSIKAATPAEVGGLLGIQRGPALNNLAGWNVDPMLMTGNGSQTTAGVGYYIKMWVPAAVTLSLVKLRVIQAGTGGTALANCFVGIFSASGTRLGLSADQSAAWAGAGAKSIAIVLDGGQSLAIAAGSYVYVGILTGTQSTTVAKFAACSTGALMNDCLVAADGFREGQLGSGLTALPTSFTVSSLTANGTGWWMGVA